MATDERAFPQAEVDGWIHSVDTMYYGGLWDTGLAGAAEQAATALMSEFGIIDAPPEVLEMLRHAIEAGYLTALQDVRQGTFDAQVRTWRPDLASA